MDLVAEQLLDRFKIQSHKKVRNFPFLMGQGVWLGSRELGIDDEVGEVLKNGTLSIGFIGLAETLVALTGSHHGESMESRNLGLEIVSFMREYCDHKSEETGLNFTLLATPAEGLSGRFIRIDKKKFGAVDERFMKEGEALLFGELAAALEIPVEEVKGYISQRLTQAAGGKTRPAVEV
jgi:ribonucleoside-triphosphate reductase